MRYAIRLLFLTIACAGLLFAQAPKEPSDSEKRIKQAEYELALARQSQGQAYQAAVALDLTSENLCGKSVAAVAGLQKAAQAVAAAQEKLDLVKQLEVKK